MVKIKNSLIDMIENEMFDTYKNLKNLDIVLDKIRVVLNKERIFEEDYLDVLFSIIDDSIQKLNDLHFDTKNIVCEIVENIDKEG